MEKQKQRKLNIVAVTVVTALLVNSIWVYGEAMQATAAPYQVIKVITREAPKVIKTGTVREVSAYNAGDPNQTDSTPCISASGDNICTLLAEGINICAANFVPLGTELHVQHFGNCIVLDRMNSRYQERVDVAMQAHEYDRAVRFGVQNLQVNIIK